MSETKFLLCLRRVRVWKHATQTLSRGLPAEPATAHAVAPDEVACGLRADAQRSAPHTFWRPGRRRLAEKSRRIRSVACTPRVFLCEARGQHSERPDICRVLGGQNEVVSWAKARGCANAPVRLIFVRDSAQTRRGVVFRARRPLFFRVGGARVRWLGDTPP